MVVRRLTRNRHVMRMRLTQPTHRDADEARHRPKLRKAPTPQYPIPDRSPPTS